MLNVIDRILDYIPLFIVWLYIMSGEECKNQSLSLLIRFSIILSMWFIFYYLTHILFINKDISFITTCLLYVLCTYIRRNHR